MGNKEYYPEEKVTVSGNAGVLTKEDDTFTDWNTRKEEEIGKTYIVANEYTMYSNTMFYENWNKFAGGTGTASDPYLISNEIELNEVRNYLELGTHFKLSQNIDLSSFANWEPIGNNTNPFNGNFDGNNYVIRHLTINKKSESMIGLFSCIGKYGKIINLGLKDVNVSGGLLVGGLASKNQGAITKCFVTGEVSGSSSVGGLVGHNIGTITNSCADGSVTGNSDVGGLVGQHRGVITNSYATGSVTGTNSVGGLVGRLYLSEIKNSYSTGSVTGFTSVGGLVGNNFVGKVTKCFYDKQATGVSDRGIYNGEGKLTNEMKNNATFREWDTTKIWAIVPTRNNGYPHLRAFNKKVSYNDNGSDGGRVPSTITLYYPKEEKFTVPGNIGGLTKEGYTFSGWTMLENGTGIINVAGDELTIVKDTTLYTKWEISKYILNGSLVNYNFAKWDKELRLTTPWAYSMVTMLYAKWTGKYIPPFSGVIRSLAPTNVK